MINSVKKILGKFITSNSTRHNVYLVGFHGDKYLLRLVDLLANQSQHFIETGANVGTTLAYVAEKYSHLHCVSCEPDADAFRDALKNTQGFVNVQLHNELSQDFLVRLNTDEQLKTQIVLYWLDAHGYGFEWPLREEVSWITHSTPQGFILIDDFKVPHLDVFGYDIYREHICSFDYIKNSLNPALTYRVIYPNYTKHTSKHHPLRGWGLIVFGSLANELNIPDDISEFIQDNRNISVL